ncbi:MAG: DsrE/DsrF-like family protein [Proteobacteria bacterium]|nr:DsrE/DsrF-like family protein [Pseudomonadota bacterium]
MTDPITFTRHATILSSNIMQDTAILFTNEGLGQADRALRLKLAENFLLTLVENDTPPKSILFYGDGVKLCIVGSNCIDALLLLQEAGVPLILCRTCLEYYGLIDRVVVGQIGNMLQITEAMKSAGKVITV